MFTSVNVKYQGVFMEVIVDGAGLDIIETKNPKETFAQDGVGTELFNKIVDDYQSMGLMQALENVGAEVNVKAGA
jgi:hypothetical protein